MPSKQYPILNLVHNSHINLLRLRVENNFSGLVQAYKLVDQNLRSYIIGPGNSIEYKLGKLIKVKDANTDRHNDCAVGINVGTLEWCVKWATFESHQTAQNKPKLLIVHFKIKDVACIPTNSDGKLRLYQCRPVKIIVDCFPCIDHRDIPS